MLACFSFISDCACGEEGGGEWGGEGRRLVSGKRMEKRGKGEELDTKRRYM